MPTPALAGDNTQSPSQAPSSAPTDMPTPSPSSSGTPPTDYVFTFPRSKGNIPMDRCRGDCDTDDECKGDLVCRQRDVDDFPIFGCEGFPDPDVGWDYCGDPPDESYPALQWCGEEPSQLLGHCQGDCDTNSDCLPGLVCHRRRGRKTRLVPYCRDRGVPGGDYCTGPPSVVVPSYEACPEGTLAPSMSITPSPTFSSTVATPSPSQVTPSPTSATAPPSNGDGIVSRCAATYGSSIEVCEENEASCTFYTRLGGASCSEYCGQQGETCVWAASDIGNSCNARGRVSCNNGFDDTICTCTLPYVKPRTPCEETYGDDVEICEERPSSCTFFAKLGGLSCNDFCEKQGETCLSASSDKGDSCETLGPNSCAARFDDNICTCSISGVMPAPTVAPTPQVSQSDPATQSPTSPPTDLDKDETPCTKKYGKEIQVCNERKRKCTFFTQLGFRSCDDFCGSRGGWCLWAAKDIKNTCTFRRRVPCNKNFRNIICTCSLEPPRRTRKPYRR